MPEAAGGALASTAVILLARYPEVAAGMPLNLYLPIFMFGLAIATFALKERLTPWRLAAALRRPSTQLLSEVPIAEAGSMPSPPRVLPKTVAFGSAGPQNKCHPPDSACLRTRPEIEVDASLSRDKRS